MNLSRSVEGVLIEVVIRVVKAQMVVPRFFAAVRRKIRSALRALVSPKGRKRGDPEDGSQGAGVPARLKPPPPVLSFSAMKAFPEPDEKPTEPVVPSAQRDGSAFFCFRESPIGWLT